MMSLGQNGHVDRHGNLGDDDSMRAWSRSAVATPRRSEFSQESLKELIGLEDFQLLALIYLCILKCN